MIRGYWTNTRAERLAEFLTSDEMKILEYFETIDFPLRAVTDASSKIAAIKFVRENVKNKYLEAIGLKEAKELVELWVAWHKMSNDKPLDNYDREVVKQFKAGVHPGNFDLVGVRRDDV